MKLECRIPNSALILLPFLVITDTLSASSQTSRPVDELPRPVLLRPGFDCQLRWQRLSVLREGVSGIPWLGLRSEQAHASADRDLRAGSDPPLLNIWIRGHPFYQRP